VSITPEPAQQPVNERLIHYTSGEVQDFDSASVDDANLACILNGI
jgi:hypothetical protein